MATREKNALILILFILCGVVLGSFLGEVATHVEWLSWLSYGGEFGLTEPVALDLGVLRLTFGLVFKINIASIIGLIIAVIIYRKF